jgi:hypothetical protein
MSTGELQATEGHTDDGWSATSAIITFLPLLVLMAMCIPFVRLVRKTQTRADEALSLSRQILDELRQIRAALERR